MSLYFDDININFIKQRLQIIVNIHTQEIIMININQSAENIETIHATVQNCRICLEPCHQFTDSYCLCRGNSQYVHMTCLMEWAKRTQKFKTKNNNIYFLCDLCKSKIFLSVEKVCSCKSKNQICSLKVITPPQALILIVFGLIFLTIAGICLYFQISNDNSDIALYVISMASLLVSLISFSIIFIKEVFVCQLKIVGFLHLIEEPSSFRIANSYTQQNL